MFLKKFILLFIIFIASQEIKAIIISGKVVMDKTENPLDAASVFLNNTTYGTLTDAKGVFKLDAPSGHYNLIVTYIGYNTYAKDIDIIDSIPFYSIVITLSPKAYSISEVVISASASEWAMNFTRFKNIFLGNTPNSSDCKILNPHSIRFYRNEKKSQLEAYSDTFILVRNEALGYLIKFKLESFISNYYESSYYGYPLFDDISKTFRNPKAILKRRVEAYDGSCMHFLRSLYGQTTEAEGFICKKIKEIAIDSTKAIHHNMMTNPLLLKKVGNQLIQTNDTLKLQAFVRVTLYSIKVLCYGEPFEVTYKKKAIMAYYENEALYSGIKSKHRQQTSILFVKSKIGLFDKSGVYLKGNDLLMAGYMGWKRVADMLPDNYEKPPISAK